MVSQFLQNTEGYVEYIFSMWFILLVLFSLCPTNLTMDLTKNPMTWTNHSTTKLKTRVSI